MLLALYIEGFERVIVVTESDVTTDILFSDDDGDGVTARAIGSGSDSNTFKKSCCVYGYCSCPTLYNAIANLTSSVIINVTADVELSSIIPIVGLSNIAITGYNNPTVYCNNSGGLHFMSCDNCTIEGITWEGCGARNVSNVYPVLQFTNSSNITIQNCSFQQSIGQAVVLSGMSGDVNINYCNFLHNKQYEGHGTAIHYSSNLLSSPIKFTITGCNFFLNEKAKSIVYFSQSFVKLCKYLKLQNSKFHHNKGVPIYLSNQDLHINGNIEFSNNIAENGGGIFISDHSNVIIHKSATVNFTNNTATNNGGAIFLTNHSSILFKDYVCSTSCQCFNELYDTSTADEQHLTDIIVTFYYNTAKGYGHNIYAHNSNIIVGNNATVTFYDFDQPSIIDSTSTGVHTEHHSNVTFEGDSKTMNTYTNGIAMYINDYSSITFKGKSVVRFFSKHGIYRNVGVVYVTDSSTTAFEGDSTVTFYHDSDIGRAMCINDNSTITFKENSTVRFNGYAYGSALKPADLAYTDVSYIIGGVVYITDYSIITFEGNSKVIFNNNTAEYGGAMYITHYSYIAFKGNSNVLFYNNTAEIGGAMYITDYSYITFEENSEVNFIANTAISGGAMYINDDSSMKFQGNSAVTFYNNRASSNGGAIYSDDAYITFEVNSTVTFKYNRPAHITVQVYGDGSVAIVLDRGATLLSNTIGAPMCITNSTIEFKGNSKVTFDLNIALLGGIMYITTNSTITFEGNSTVTFNNNIGEYSGAMNITDYSIIMFEENSTVTFHNNEGFYHSGALSITKHSSITFKGYSTIEFDSNKCVRLCVGALYITEYSNVIFEGSSTITLNNNTGTYGTMYITDYSIATFEGNPTVTFINNKADYGGAVYIDGAGSIALGGNSNVLFYNNTAEIGGAMFITGLFQYYI